MEELLKSEIVNIEKEIAVIENKMKKLIEKNGISCIEKLNKLNQETNIKYAQVFKLQELLGKSPTINNKENKKMYVYRLEMSYEDENMEDGLGWDNEYISSPTKYTSEEFRNICSEAIEVCKENNVPVEIFAVKDVLTGDYDYEFESMKIESFFDFEEE